MTATDFIHKMAAKNKMSGLPASRFSKGVRDREFIGVDTVYQLVAHASDGTDALLCPAVDPAASTQGRQLLVQPTP